MARIAKAEHARILHLADVEGRRVADIAGSYGCTPANIYALLSRLRRVGTGANPDAAAVAPLVAPSPSASGPASEPASLPEPVPASPVTAGNGVVDLFAAVDDAPSRLSRPAEVSRPATDGDAPVPVSATGRRPVLVGGVGNASPSRSDPPAKGVGAAAARPGFGLLMRTGDGEETLTPFRSLEDLLSAVKPILRAAAGNPDPVWFSIQPVDLASVAFDAA